MKKLIFVVLLLLSFLSFAQSTQSQFLSMERSNFGRTSQQKITQTNKVLELAELLASEKGILTERINLKTRTGEIYPALVILSEGSSIQNKEAGRVAKEMGQLPLIFSPFDLSSGAAAFFDPSGSKLGVPYNFFSEGIASSSYRHELYHADTYAKLISGKKVLWAGVMRLTRGTYLTSSNKHNYFRFASLDELNATSLSVDHETKTLAELNRTQTSADYYRSRGAADQTLNIIYQTTLDGQGLAKQSAELAEKSLSKLSSAVIKKKELQIGKLKKTIFEVVFILESYDWEIVGGRGTMASIPEGSQYSLYFPTLPTLVDIQKRLEEIRTKSINASKALVELEKKIDVMIEYPRLEKTDLKAMEILSPKIFEGLEK